MEKQKNYYRAIECYKKATKNMNGVSPDLIEKAKIAAHNRTGACYRALGKREEAITEFQISLGLGDTKYAPLAIEKLMGNSP